MALPNYPNNPSLNDTFVVGENTYQWDGEKWKALSNADASLRTQLAQTISNVLVGGVEAGILANNVVYLLSYKDLVVDNDWTAAFNQAYADLVSKGGGTLEMPVGTFKVSGTGIETLTSNTYYLLSNVAVRFRGQGLGTILTRDEKLATDTVDLDDATTFHDSVFNIHNSNNIFESFAIKDAKSAFYLGQKDGSVDTCSVVFNKFKNIWIVDSGMGIHLRSGIGNYYNSFEDMHIWQCQIAGYLDKHPSSAIEPPNNNRNQMRHVRSARCHVGLWIKMGDTNQFIGQHNEGNTLAPTANRYNAPEPLPLGLTGGVGQLLEENAINNKFVACMQEACEVELVNNGDRNSFSGLYRDEESGKVQHLKFPIFYSTRTMSVTNSGKSFYFTNAQSGVFSGYAAGKLHNLIETVNTVTTSTEATILGDVSTGTYNEQRVYTVGSLASSGTASIPLWGDNVNEALSAGMFEVTIVGNCQESNLAHTTKCKLLALRNASRTLVRYHIYDTSSGRATGANAGDSAEPFVTALSVSSKDLILDITAPARNFDNVVVVISKVVSKTV